MTAVVPTPGALALSPRELAAYSRFAADDVAAGRYPFIEYDEHERWHQRLYRDHRVDLWLISWMPSQGTELHDHGGSAGAFTVVKGELAEAVCSHRALRGGSLVERVRATGSTSQFNANYIHDVRNLSDSPAVSVHAYSPPLTVMNYYDIDDRGALSRIASLATDDPEPDVSFSQPAA